MMRRAGLADYYYNAADRERATLICMGAGAHENSRAAERVGGNTRHLYSRSGVPVLFSY